MPSLEQPEVMEIQMVNDRQEKCLHLAMENAALLSDMNNVTTSSPDDDLSLYLANIRDLALKIVYIIIGTVGVIDNLFVVVVFIMFIKITDKVIMILQ